MIKKGNKHLRTCENCKTPLLDNSRKCPSCGMKIIQMGDSGRLYVSYKIAAMMLIINSLFLVAELFIMEEYDPIGHSIGSIIVGLVMGVLILANKRGVLIWARIAIIFGAVVFTAIQLANQNYFGVVIQLLFSLSLLGLIFGKPGNLRIGICTAFLIFYVFLELDGLQAEHTGRSIFARVLSSTTGFYESIENGTVYGSDKSYILEIPNANWKRRSERYAKKDNPSADVWLMYPDYDAHIIMVHEVGADSLIFDLELITDAVIQNARIASESLIVEKRECLVLTSGISGKTLVTTCEIDSLVFQFRYGIFTIKNHAFQIVCFSLKDIFAQVENDFDEVINSFSPHPDLVLNGVEK